MARVLDEAWAVADKARLEGLPPLASDIRVMCHHVVPGRWTDRGHGNELRVGRYRLMAQAQGGYNPFEIVVGIIEDGCQAIRWHRTLDRYTGGSESPPDWLVRVLSEAHAEIRRLDAATPHLRVVGVDEDYDG